MSKKVVVILFFILASIGFFLGFLLVKSTNTNIIITEIGASEATGYEWLEIYNRGTDAIDLTGWKFWENNTNHALALKQGDMILDPGEFAIITQDDQKFLQKYPNVTSTILDSSWTSLSEDGEEIGLKSGTGVDDFIEKFTYIATDSFSLERRDPLSDDYTVVNWVEHLSENTVGQKNSVTGDFVSEEEILLPVDDIILEEGTNSSPKAVLDVSSSTIFLGTEIQFDASRSTDSDGNIVSYSWYFGDENISEGVSVSHSYTVTGTFVVELTVIDDTESGDIVTTSVRVVPVDFLTELTVPSSSEAIPTSSVPDIAMQEEPPVESVNTTEEIAEVKIFINEIVSSPVSGKEWIELWNVGASDLDLTGFTLSDGVGVIAKTTSTIHGGEFFVFELASSRLNNSGDVIILKDSDGKVIDQVSYGDWNDGDISDNPQAPVKAESLARKKTDIFLKDKEKFSRTTSPTKGNENSITEPIVEKKRVTEKISDFVPLAKQNTETKVLTENKVHWNFHNIVINELVSDPSENGEEFVELFNNTSKEIDLTGATLKDGSGAVTSLSGNIFAKGFFVVKSPKGNLNNGGDRVELFDPSGVLVESVSYGDWDDGDVSDNAPVSYDPMGLSREVDGVDTDDDKADFVLTLDITPLSKNNIRQAKIFDVVESANAKKVFISEVFPNPIGDDIETEYIKVSNPTESKISLVGWSFEDESGSRYLIQEKVMESFSSALFSRKVTSISLNNTGGDMVKLFDAEKSLVDTLEYKESADEGAIYTKNDDGIFLWVQKETQKIESVKNRVVTKTSSKKAPKKVAGKKIVLPQKVEIVSLRDMDKGSVVKVRGVVTVLPGVLGSQYFYIQDNFAGIQTYVNKKEFPTLSIGDSVEVLGQVSEAYGESRINVKAKEDIVVVGHENISLPEVVEIANIGESMEGVLVHIKGEVTEIKTSHMFVDDGSSEIKVYFKPNVNILKDEIRLGTLIGVFGIVVPAKDGYQILLRGQEDIEREQSNADVEIIDRTEENKKDERVFRQYLVLGAGAGVVFICGLLYKLYGVEMLRFLKQKK